MAGWIPKVSPWWDAVSFWGSMTGRFASLLGIAVLGGLCGGCEPGAERNATTSRSERGDDLHLAKIVVIGTGQDDPAWEVLRKTCEAFASQDARLDIDLRAPKVVSPREQQELLASIRVKRGEPSGVDVVCLMPVNPSSIHATLDDISLSGIPVITIGRDVPDSGRRMYCGPSAHEIGEAAARACRAAVEGRSPRVMLLQGGEHDVEYAVRRHAFLAELPVVAGPELMREVDCGGNRTDALRLVKYEAKRYPRVGAWVFLEDWPFRSLQQDDRLLPLGCGIVLCNGSPAYFSRVRDGRIHSLIAYDLHRAIEEALYVARSLAMREAETFKTSLRIVPSEIITNQELPAYEARWAKWRQGQPSSKDEHAADR